MLYNIKNEKLELEISDHGAEIKRVKFMNEDRLHDSNPIYWNRSAPLLFPCVGTILNKQTLFDDQPFPLTKHGFIRDVDFTLVSKNENKIVLKFESNDYTLSLYPFTFEFIVTYELVDNKVKSFVQIKNTSNKDMPFNFGLHPAFKAPLKEDENFEDYELVIHSSKEAPVYKVDVTNGTINLNEIVRTIDFKKPLPLNHHDYQFDALVFDHIDFDTVTLQNKTKTHGVKFTFDDFPMLGIWTPYPTKATFICIEPWIGCADLSNHDGKFIHKPHLIILKPEMGKEITYQWEFF